MKEISKIISVKQTDTNEATGGQPEWEVIFEAGGNVFRLERVVQWNEPELSHIQDQKWVWELAKPHVL